MQYADAGEGAWQAGECTRAYVAVGLRLGECCAVVAHTQRCAWLTCISATHVQQLPDRQARDRMKTPTVVVRACAHGIALRDPACWHAAITATRPASTSFMP
eukprot:TRINITY_DN4712_c0_g1_i1.p1 TRINITY_DN4712_c0_g1~~TRINITY_DN4712_c0_g1_i1.p1  ORF type:complete len:102 (-),score=6.53 TRINITY_DN4712_c0_g1_i1:320-625(-)